MKSAHLSKRATLDTVPGNRESDKCALNLKIRLSPEGLIMTVLNGSLNWCVFTNVERRRRGEREMFDIGSRIPKL